MVRTRQPGEAAIGLNRSERIYWRPFALPLIKVKVRAVVKLMQHGHLETIMFDGFYIGLGDRSTTIGGLFAENRHRHEFERALNRQHQGYVT